MKARKLLCGLLTIVMLIAIFAGCNSGSSETSGSSAAEPSSEASQEASGETSEETPSEAVVIPYMQNNAGNDANYELYSGQIEQFNEKYAGQYVIETDWLEGGSDVLREKLKVLGSSGVLPAVIQDLHTEPDFRDLLIKNGRLADLKSAIDSDADWRAMFTDDNYNRAIVDGSIYVEPAYYSQYVGIFYNKEHFEAAGVADYPLSWDLDMFWEACEKIQAAGFDPIANYVAEQGWGYTLFQTAVMGATEEGQEFMWTSMPSDYTVDVFKKSLEVLKKSYDYSTSDALSIGYTEAASYFYGETASMFFNGPWMIESLFDTSFCAEGFADKIGYAPFPEMGMIDNTGGAGSFAVTTDHSEEVQAGAIEFLKFLATPEQLQAGAVKIGNASPLVPLTEEQLSSLSLPMQEYFNAVERCEYTVPSYQGMWPASIQHTVLNNYSAEFAGGKISVDEYAQLFQDYASEE